MRTLVALMTAVLLSSSAFAEVVTAIDTPKGAVTPLSKDAPIWVKCFGCDVMKDRVLQRLKEAGYAIVAKPADASTKVVIAAGVSVPQDGKVPRLLADEVYGKGLVAIPPALKPGEGFDVNTPTVGKGVLHLDAGHQTQGAQLTGSQTGGIVIGLGTALLTRLIHQSAADSIRTPGVVELSVRIDTEQATKMGFGVMAAATTAETPDSLLDAALDAAIHGLINGVPDTKAAKSAMEGNNVQ